VAAIITRRWKASGPNARPVWHTAYGYTIQVPCRPCSHKGRKNEVAHPDGVRQVRVFNVGWTKDDAQSALAARQLGLTEEKTKATADDARRGV
jgi:hypothetical protein